MTSEASVSSFEGCSEATLRLSAALERLDQKCDLLEIAPLRDREWYELLRRKLVPQLKDGSYLVSAVVGGTNIGKSVIFNHLAGTRASLSSPLASGTKHPVCLIPEGFLERRQLTEVFPGFELADWTEGAALIPSDSHMLFWQPAVGLPENLLLLDTPDIDSDAPVNWQRAEAIRQCSDALIAVLTQQKYNDAAVKKFFRLAASEDKAIIVVFNQCLLPDDEEYWPHWLKTFCDETGVHPEAVYVVPNDRAAAEQLNLPFFERIWPRGSRDVDPEASCNLRDELARLKFAEVKLKAIQGSFDRILDSEYGVHSYLREVISSSDRFQKAVEILSQHRLASQDDWPSVPNQVLVSEIRTWWQSRRQGWSKHVHEFYNMMGTSLMWPVRKAKEKLSGPAELPMESYLEREWTAILRTVETAFERLEILADMGNPLLRERLQGVLAGTSRSALLRRLEAAHGELDLQAELTSVVRTDMDRFESENPRMYTLVSRMDKAAAVVRPVTTVALFVTGLGPAGQLASQVVTDTAIQTAVQVVGDATGVTVAVAVGDSAAASGLGTIEAQLRNLHATFALQRVSWLMELLNRELWGPFLGDLQEAAWIGNSSLVEEVRRSVNDLERSLSSVITKKSS